MSKLFVWYNKYSVNNEELDAHHKALFDIINRLYENCVEVDNAISIEPLIKELVSYTQYHFSAEEQYMMDIGYKDINKQISEHMVFTDRILQLQRDDNLNDCGHSKELIVFLGNWLFNHVIVEDKKITAAPAVIMHKG
jgi:hemerythrin